jgi:hypothetical protein
MANNAYFGFLGTVWESLTDADKNKFAELWHGYEQVFATIYQGTVENSLNICVHDMLQYQQKRWLLYNFTAASAVLRNPVYTSSQDLSVGIRTDTKYMLKFLIDNTQTVEVNIQGANPLSTTIDEIIFKINKACGFTFARGIFENTIIQLTSRGTGSTAGISILETTVPTRNAAEFILGVMDTPYEVPYYPYAFSMPYDHVKEIPNFRTKVRDETENQTILTVNTDYVIESNNVVAFKMLPPEILWAKSSYIDEETPWNNFGFMMGIYDQNTTGYLSVIQGLWHAFWTGPRPENIRTSLYLLFGLPVALDDSVVTLLSATEIQTTSETGLLRTYAIPTELNATVVLGEAVSKFQPLVDGISVYDKINLPGFIKTEIGRAGIQQFLTENATRGVGDTDETKALDMLEEHTFLPQVSVNAFISPDINLGNIKLFLSTIRPLHKTFLSQVIVGEFRDAIDLKEQLGIHISMDITPNLDSNQTTFLDQATLLAYETSDNEALNLDSEVALMQESVLVEVYSFGVLIDSFAA